MKGFPKANIDQVKNNKHTQKQSRVEQQRFFRVKCKPMDHIIQGYSGHFYIK